MNTYTATAPNGTKLTRKTKNGVYSHAILVTLRDGSYKILSCSATKNGIEKAYAFNERNYGYVMVIVELEKAA